MQATISRLTAERDAALADTRWAVNVLLETIAAKFEANPTWDIWRSDAAALVRSFKHALATPSTPQESAKVGTTIGN